MIRYVTDGCVVTTGCGCCSDEIPLTASEEIIGHIEDNLIVAKNACDALGLPFAEVLEKLQSEGII